MCRRDFCSNQYHGHIKCCRGSPARLLLRFGRGEAPVTEAVWHLMQANNYADMYLVAMSLLQRPANLEAKVHVSCQQDNTQVRPARLALEPD